VLFCTHAFRVVPVVKAKHALAVPSSLPFFLKSLSHPSFHTTMLVLSRKPGQTIHIGDDIEITVAEVEYDKVRIAISAPREVFVVRGELMNEIKALQEKFKVRET